MKQQHKHKSSKLRGNRNASRGYRRNSALDKSRNMSVRRKIVDARSNSRIINNSNRQQQEQPVQRSGVAAERTVSGYWHNGKHYFGGYHL